MKAYSFDPNWIYIGETDCQLDPVQTQKTGENVYLLPASATWEKPPEYDPETHRASWNGFAWTIEELPKEPEPEPERADYIPTAEESLVVMMRASFNQQVSTMEDDVIIQCSGLAEDWAPGDHKMGDVYNTRAGVHADGPEWDQTWECHQAYDNATFPDIKPGNSSWFTFNRPLHGKSPETARPWVAPMGAHDMYRADEYMVFTDGKTYRCKSDTNFSPTDYAQAWEVVE